MHFLKQELQPSVTFCLVRKKLLSYYRKNPKVILFAYLKGEDWK